MKNLILFPLFLMTFYNLKSQSIRSININKFKYIVLDEISGKNEGRTRRFVVNSLQKAGYDVVNFSDPLKTYDDYPADLKENKNKSSNFALT